MKKPRFINGAEAAEMISDNSTIATIGMTLVSASETILKAVEHRFLTEGSPKNLTLVHSCGQLFRSMAGGEPGKITKVGLGTFVDPRLDGVKMNEITKSAPDISDVVTIDGEEYMRYKPIPLDYVIIRGTYVDELGNLTTDEEAMSLEVFPAVLACKKFGGKVIAQAKYKVKSGQLHCKRVTVPGVFIDACVMIRKPITGRHTVLPLIPPTAVI